MVYRNNAEATYIYDNWDGYTAKPDNDLKECIKMYALGLGIFVDVNIFAEKFCTITFDENVTDYNFVIMREYIQVSKALSDPSIIAQYVVETGDIRVHEGRTELFGRWVIQNDIQSDVPDSERIMNHKIIYEMNKLENVMSFAKLANVVPSFGAYNSLCYKKWLREQIEHPFI